MKALKARTENKWLTLLWQQYVISRGQNCTHKSAYVITAKIHTVLHNSRILKKQSHHLCYNFLSCDSKHSFHFIRTQLLSKNQLVFFIITIIFSNTLQASPSQPDYQHLCHTDTWAMQTVSITQAFQHYGFQQQYSSFHLV